MLHVNFPNKEKNFKRLSICSGWFLALISDVSPGYSCENLQQTKQRRLNKYLLLSSYQNEINQINWWHSNEIIHCLTLFTFVLPNLLSQQKC
jgi:hypothetical protein